MKDYSDRIKELTERAKEGNDYSLDCDIGETAYLETLIHLIERFKDKKIDKETLVSKKKTLARKLERYYQHCEMFDENIEISIKCGHILTEAEKHGCPICKKLVRVFDGRDRNG